MKKNQLIALLILSCLIFSAVNAQEIITSEEFEDINDLVGWEFVNMSSPIGETDWFQGNPVIFGANFGELPEYIAANHRNVDSVNDGTAVICNYLIMPDLGALETVSFSTRSSPASNNFDIYPDRLYVVYSPDGGTNVGNCVDDFGDFTETLLVINEDLSDLNYPVGYPLTSWIPFDLEVNGSGRIAFVYYVTDAGFFGTNSNYVGIDSVEWVFQVDDPVDPPPETALFESDFE